MSRGADRLLTAVQRRLSSPFLSRTVPHGRSHCRLRASRTDRDVLRRGAGARGRADDRGGGLSTCYLLLQGRSGTGHSVGRRCSLSCWHGKKREKRRFTTW